jgi:hypothetical protein
LVVIGPVKGVACGPGAAGFFCGGRGHGFLVTELEALDESQGFFELGEQGFFRFECGGVDAATEATHFYWMLEVEHLVVEQVLDCIART